MFDLAPSGKFPALMFVLAAIMIPVCTGQTPGVQNPEEALRTPQTIYEEGFHGAGALAAPKSYPEAEAEAEANTPPAGYASLYILEPSKGFAARVNAQGPTAMCFERVLVDGKDYWGLRPGRRYSWDPLPPGPHTLKWAKTTLTVNAEPGKAYYVVVSGRGKMAIAPSGKGENIRKKLPLNPDRWLLRQYDANWSKVQQGMPRQEVDRLLGPSGGRYIVRIVIVKRPVTNDLATISKTVYETFFSNSIGYSISYVDGIVDSKTDRPDDYFAGCTMGEPWR